MQITQNNSPFLAEIFFPTDKNGQRFCTIVVKATYAVGPDGRCTVAEEQLPFVFSDQHYGDPGSTAILHECDFVPNKPYADVLLVGAAISPTGRPVKELGVAFAGPGFSKTAVVSGDRRWERRLGRIAASAPEPFVEIALSWDFAFGGADNSSPKIENRGCELRNPVGRGFTMGGDADVLLDTILPNIERQDARMISWDDRPAPVGFGPVGRGWSPRIGYAGTYDRQWIETKRPFLPDDFDPRYFQSAPADQQIESLQEGMTFGCRNMNSSGHFLATLPPLGVPVRFILDDLTEARIARPDTLIIYPATSQVVILSRASFILPRKLTRLREIHVGVGQRASLAGVTRYPNLGEAVSSLRGKG